MDKLNRSQILRIVAPLATSLNIVNDAGEPVKLPDGAVVYVALPHTPIKQNAIAGAERMIDDKDKNKVFDENIVDNNNLVFASFYHYMKLDSAGNEVIDESRGLKGLYTKGVPQNLTPYEAWFREAAFKVKDWHDAGQDRAWFKSTLPLFFQGEANRKGFTWLTAMQDFDLLLDKLDAAKQA